MTPLEAIYFCFPIADLLSVVTAAILMAFEMKKLNAKIRTSASAAPASA